MGRYQERNLILHLCQAGSLIKAIGGDEDMTSEEFASCVPAEYETAITGLWLYSTRVDDDQQCDEGV